MTMTRDTSFRIGDTFKVIISNKPYVDLSIPPESNDYRWAEYSCIKIYDSCERLMIQDSMCPFENRIGWYYYNYNIPMNSKLGLWKVEITLGANIPKCGIDACTIPATAAITHPTNTCPTTSTASTGTTGTSGNPYYDLVENKAINYFRVINLEIL